MEHLVKWTCPEPLQWKQNTTKLSDLHVPNGSSCTSNPQEVKTKGKLGEGSWICHACIFVEQDLYNCLKILSQCYSLTDDGHLFIFPPDDVSGVQHRVKVLSYPQYCRFRSLQKRIQSHAGWSSPQDPHLLALGWIKMTLQNTRILYCRDTFSHPSLGTNPSLTPEFGEFIMQACVFNKHF